MLEFTQVPFLGATLYVVEHDGEPYIPLKPIVQGMGLAWRGYSQKLKANRARWDVRVIPMPIAGRRQEAVCIPLPKLPAWLAALQPAPLGAEVRASVAEYRKGCADTLWRFWKQARARSPNPPAAKAIRSRDDLSFTRRDERGRLVNWSVPHDPGALWEQAVAEGGRYFDEIAALAGHDEKEAYDAVRFALSGSREFRRGPGTDFRNAGWGREDGFAEGVARAVIDGLRARRRGQAPFDPGAGRGNMRGNVVRLKTCACGSGHKEIGIFISRPSEIRRGNLLGQVTAMSSSFGQNFFDRQAGERRSFKVNPDDRRAGRERRRMERRHKSYFLECREARLHYAAQAAGFGVFDLDWNTGESLWSPELRAMAGLRQDDVPLSTEEAESCIHPDDRPAIVEKLQASMDPGSSGVFEEEHRLVRQDGSVCWVRTKGRTFFADRDGERRPLATTGIVMDVTEHRAAAQALAESRHELDKLVESAIDSIVTIDAEQRIIRFNPSAERMFRCPAQSAIGARLEPFMPERYRADHAEKVRQFAESAEPAKALDAPRRFSGLRADGEEFLFEATITKVNVDGRSRMTSFMRDITDRVKAEEDLRRSKEDLELAVRGANIGIWHWDLRNGQVELSERCRQLFGIPAGQPLSYDLLISAIHPDDRFSVESLLRRALDTGEEYKFEKRVIWPDGSVHWLECIGRDLHEEEGGKAVGMRGVSMDVTERKRHEERLQHSKADLECRVEERTAELMRSNEALERSNLDLKQFAYIAAHDLQTPLRAISSFAQLLQKDYQGRLDPRADLWLAQLVRSAQRMHELIRDVLAYSRVDSRGSAFAPTDFNRIFEDVVALLDVPIRESGAVVTRDALPVVAVDRTQLAQVLQNLVDNAVKYRSSEPPRIHVSAAHADGEWVFAVRDNGIGMAEKHLEHIFDIFRRLHTEQEYPGTGIGLAVCRRVIHRHGGRIWAVSEPGRGSTFYFTLPDGGNAPP